MTPHQILFFFLGLVALTGLAFVIADQVKLFRWSRTQVELALAARPKPLSAATNVPLTTRRESNVQQLYSPPSHELSGVATAWTQLQPVPEPDILTMLGESSNAAFAQALSAISGDKAQVTNWLNLAASAKQREGDENLARQFVFMLTTMHNHHTVHQDITPASIIFVDPDATFLKAEQTLYLFYTSNDQPEVASISLDENTIPRVEAFLRSVRKIGG